MSDFLNLPPEILIAILHSLDLSSLVACIATNRRVKSIIDGSASLQYRLATQAACVEDNPYGATNMTSADRLRALRKRQIAFAELLPSSISTIQMDKISFLHTYTFSGGILALTESTEQSLRWISLASIGQSSPVWERLELDEYILEIILAVPEEDLLVVLSSTSSLHGHPPPTGAVLKLRFYEISTGSAHRNAQDPVIIVPMDVVGRPSFHVDICGPRVSVMMEIFNDTVEQRGRLLVYNWKQGQLQMDLVDNYSAAVFLSTEIILLAQETGGILQLWAIPDVPERIAGPRISLKLPRLPNHHEYYIVRAEYNPKGNHTPASRQPFHSSLVHSLVILNIARLHLDDDDKSARFRLVIPRRALLEQFSSGQNHGEERSWADWGPFIGRWFAASAFPDGWPSITCGQRCILLTPDRHILLLDFNPYTWKRTLLEKARRNGIAAIPATDQFVFVPSSELDVGDELAWLGEQVHSRLGYVAKKSRKTTNWDSVMIDEEWIVGVKDTIELDGKLAFEVWHFG
ncbi:hypothetical protein MVEN_01063200 [Mycena venus]|uniref:F-box domain-containing protein n=1 Tax=Mycena venus TaxID=2733690 RepID=A0A8H6Y6X3_9AGAR|nr:hypothetical protein MVEN_01063200 [Mycena venus]